MADQLVRLQSGNGPTWVSIVDVIVIGPVMKRAGHPPSRVICLRGGHRVYALDTEANLTSLFGPGHGIEPSETHEPAAKAPLAHKRGRRSEKTAADILLAALLSDAPVPVVVSKDDQK